MFLQEQLQYSLSSNASRMFHNFCFAYNAHPQKYSLMVHHLNFKNKYRKLVFGSYQSTIHPVGNKVYAYTLYNTLRDDSASLHSTLHATFLKTQYQGAVSVKEDIGIGDSSRDTVLDQYIDTPLSGKPLGLG